MLGASAEQTPKLHAWEALTLKVTSRGAAQEVVVVGSVGLGRGLDRDAGLFRQFRHLYPGDGLTDL
jgi:hypothetical protein